jgi:hypothetical protein
MIAKAIWAGKRAELRLARKCVTVGVRVMHIGISGGWVAAGASKKSDAEQFCARHDALERDLAAA